VAQLVLVHNTSFVPRAANNMLFILTDEQKALLIALGKEQEKMLTDFAHKRFPLIKAFHRQLTGDIPAGSAGLNREAVMKYAAELYEIDGTLSYRRAEVLGGVVRSFTDKQKEYLGKMKFNNSATWPDLKDQVDKRGMSHTAHVAVMTYASEMFSWYAGSVDADVYFCPERHATYFGSFYMKDIPAMGNPNFSISTSLTGDSGEAFLATLTEPQRKLVTGLVDQQRADMAEVVKTRREISTLLRSFMKQDKVDKDRVMALSRRYGELDGEISYFYAKAFADVAKTLTADQKKTLMKLRNLDPKYTPKGAYLFSAPIDMPEIPNTDFLFAAPATGKPAAAATTSATSSSFRLTSPEVVDGGTLPKDYTGDGSAATLPLEWAGAPAGTKSFALIMHHVAPDQTKWYWILCNIPATTMKLPKNVRGVGTLGTNSVNDRTEYAPPHSKGPGAKTYVYTVYALSAPVQLDVKPADVNRDVLLAAMKDKILASAELKVVYTRNVQADPPEKSADK
jgi:Raf kinase inhibitor-like YbhB/YbcL family protein